MARRIHCVNCSKQFIEDAKKYNELVGTLEGEAKGNYICDACGEGIVPGEGCSAITLINTYTLKT